MIGLGFQEVLTYSMTSLDHLFTKMNLSAGRVIEVANPKMTTLTCLRSWLLPSVMKFLGNNTHVDYPQKVFEVGFCVILDRKCESLSRDVKKLACALTHSKASFAESKSVLDSLLSNIGIRYEIEETKHGSFIDGRVGMISVKSREVGIIGEINPKVLESWKIENPTAAFELDADSLLDLKQREK
jgi:phenylalanyl-tRNA synthetase beta chain